MKKFNFWNRTLSLFFISVLLIAGTGTIFSQARIGSTDYTTLKAAFDAINAGTHTGNITITIQSNLTESATAVLNASGSGSASYTSVTIYPTGSYSISGSLTNALIQLHGADNVTIDGRQNQSGTTNSLTLRNDASSSAAVIWVDSVASGTGAGANDNTIRNCNIIGGSTTTSSCYGILAGSSASLTTGAGGNSNLKIKYNTFAKAYYGIRIYGLSSATVNGLEVEYNIFGSSTDPIGYYASYFYYCYSPKIRYNEYFNISPTTTAYVVYLYYCNYASIQENLFRDIKNGSTHYGIYGSSCSYLTIENNTWRNNTSTSTMYCMYLTSCSYPTIKNNTIKDIYNGNVTSYGAYLTSCTNAVIHDNTVTNFASGYNCYASYLTSCNYASIQRNNLNTLRSHSTSGYGVFGIYVSSGTADTIVNNVIYNLTSTNYSTSSLSYNPFGIFINGGTGHKIYYNSVNLYGSQSGTNTNGTLSACIHIATSATGFDMRNNTFSNSLVGLTGSNSYAVYIAGTGALTGSTINYNNYYASGTYGRLGYIGSQKTTITDWRTATSQDAQSFASDPSFNANNNLRPRSGSPLAAAGVAITAFSRDFLNVSRSATTPTIGAYEQTGDFAGPAISFTELTNTTSTSNRTLNNVAITDDTGVNTTSNKPRLYYKRELNSNTYNDNTAATEGWKWVEATGTGPFSFTLDYSKLYDGVIPGDIIQYFIIAQDNQGTPYVSNSSGEFASAPTSVALTSSNFPITGTITSYAIQAVLSGTITVGTGGTFRSLTNPGGLFTVLNNGTMSGDLTVEIISDIAETGTNALNQWTESGSGNYTMTIKSSAAIQRKLSGSYAGGLIRLNGADRVVFDGRIAGSGRYLSFENTSTAANTAVFHIISLGTSSGANNVTIRNTKIIGGSNSVTSAFGVHASTSTISTSATGADNDNLTITENEFNRCYIAVYARGVATTAYLDNLSITKNVMGAPDAANYVTYRGVDIQSCNAPNVSGNRIYNLILGTSVNQAGIEMGQYCQNAIVDGNIIYGMRNTAIGGYGVYGINISTSTGNTGIRISNNVIYDLLTTNYSASSTTYNPFGIRIVGGTGYSIYYNSINLFGTQLENTSYNAGTLSACLLVTSTAVTGLDIRNNVFSNKIEGLSGTNSYCIYLPGTGNLTSSNFNNNDYYPSGTYGVLGYLGSAKTTLTDWKNATSMDGNSFSSDPSFNLDNNLRPLPGSSLANAGTTLTAVTSDFLGVTRSNSSPTVGAYEQTGDFAGPAITFTPLGNTTQTSTRTITNFATITDYTGVNTTTGTRPRIYYKKSTHNNEFNDNTASTNGWKWVEASGTGSSPFSFSMDFTKLFGGTPSVNDVIEYFVVAQDITSGTFVNMKNGEFSNIPINVNLTSNAFPILGTPNSFMIKQAISGTLSVGTGQTYTSLTRSDGLFAAINDRVVTGNITVNITSDLTTEDGITTLNQISEEFGSGFSITIRPNAAAARAISGSSTNGLIKLNGVDNLIFDGSFNGSGRYLTITNTNTGSSTARIHINGSGDGAKNIKIRNLNLIGGSSTATPTFGIYAAGSSFSITGSGGNHDGLEVSNCIITKSSHGVYVGSGSGTKSANVTISNNQIGSTTTADYITLRGISVQGCDAPSITENSIFNLISSYSSYTAGIDLIQNVNDAMIARNKISSLRNQYYYYDDYYGYEDGFGSYGININSTTGISNISIVNNMIWDVRSWGIPGSTMYNPFGIRMAGGSGNKVWHNTVYMSGSFYGSSWSSNSLISACLIATTTSVSNLDMRNNIFYNKMTGPTGAKTYSAYVPTSFSFSQSNFNNYFSEGTNGVLGYYGMDRINIGEWQTSSGKDANSAAKIVTFISDTDLHLNGGSVGDVTLLADNIGVNDDIDKETRRTSNANMGADEVRPILTLTTDINKISRVVCEGEDVQFTYDATITGYGDKIARTTTNNISSTWFFNGNEIDDITINELNLDNVGVDNSGTYMATASFGGESINTSSSTLPIQSPISILDIPASQDVCEGDNTISLLVDAIGTITGYQWQKESKTQPGVWNDIQGQITNNLLLFPDNPEEATGKYRLKVKGPGNCGPAEIITSEIVIFVNYPIRNVSTSTEVDLDQICVASSFSITANATGTVYGYQWQKFENGTFQNLDPNKYPTSRQKTLLFETVRVDESGRYRCQIFGSAKCNTALVETDELQVTIWPEIEFRTQPKSQNVCRGGSIQLDVDLDGIVYSYQWQKDEEDIDPSMNPSADDPEFQLSDMDYFHSGTYRCKVEIEDCKGRRFIYSKDVLVYVHTETEFLIEPPVAYTSEGATVQFEIKAHADGDHYEILWVQWYKGLTPLVDNDRIAGSQSSILTIKDIQPTDVGNDYWARVHGICGTDDLTGVAIYIPDIRINTQPANASVCENANAQFSADVESIGGQSIDYQWFIGANSLTEGSKYVGTKTNTLTINSVMLADETAEIYLQATVFPGGKTVTTNQVALDVKVKPEITTNLNPTLEVQTGRELNLTVAAIGDPLIQYQWYKDNTEIPNEINASYIVPAADDTYEGAYKCKVYNECGEVFSAECLVSVTLENQTDITESSDGSLKMTDNYPNPFTNSTVVKVISTRNRDARLSIHDVFGKEVALVFEGSIDNGAYTYQIDANSMNLVSGVYYITLNADGYQLTKRMVLVK